MKALVVAGGEIDQAADLPAADRQSAGAADGVELVIAADGGLDNARRLGLPVDVVVGDGDSLTASAAELAEASIEFQRHFVDKDASDTELALREAVRRGATEVTLVGALGGLRIDHGLANVLLLAAAEPGARLTLRHGSTSVRALAATGGGRLEIEGTAGDIVSLLPLSGEVGGVRLAGLRYPLDGQSLRRGSTVGLSNVMLGPRATVEIDSGCLLIVHVEGVVGR